ncbi:hypothetical protein Sste5344_008762 [Sporothrix stenoceras]
MPLRSMELFHHMTHFRILTRSLVPKNPNNSCIAMVLQDAGLFRGCILLTAMHYAWINGGLGDMEETYLYHKVEAIRMVNEHISDPAWSELCANVIAALALAESGIGDISAAEAHLNGLFTLINWRKPEEWQGRLHGLFQRLILVAGTFISASKGLEDGLTKHTNTNSDITGKQAHALHFTRPTTAHFSAAQFDATKLSPFYFVTPPDYEASNADLEGIAITNALQRLSSLPDGYKQCQPAQSSRAHQNHQNASATSSSRVAASLSPVDDDITVGQELTQVLLLETETYLTSLLFRPDAPPISMALGRQMYQPPERLTSMNNNKSPYRQTEPEVEVDGHTTPTLTRSQSLAGAGMNDIMDPFMMDFDPRLFSPSGFLDIRNNNTTNIHNNNTNNTNASGSMSSTAPSPTTSHTTTSTNHSAHSAHAASAYSAAASPLGFRTPSPTTVLPSITLPSNTNQPVPSSFASTYPPYSGPFEGVSPSLVPSASRAWSAGAYLYLHTFLADLWLPPRPPSYLPPNYPPPTQSRIDRDLCRWLLDTLCANLERTREAMQLGAYSRELWIWQVLVGAYVVAKTRYEDEEQTAADEASTRRQAHAQPIDPTLLDPADLGFERYRMSSATMPSASPAATTAATTSAPSQKPPEYYLGAWFRKQMRVWADAVDAPHWNDAKRNARTVAWPQKSWSGDAVLEDLWSRAMTGQGSPCGGMQHVAFGCI